MTGNAPIMPVCPRHVDQCVTDLDIGENQRRYLGIALINGIETSCCISSDNVGWIQCQSPAIRLLRIRLNDLDRAYALRK
jgi:hypothetical protein